MLLAGWIALLLAIPGYLFLSEFVPRAHRLINYARMDLTLSHDVFYPVIFDQVRLVSPSDGRENVYTRFSDFKSSEPQTLLRYAEFEQFDLRQKFQAGRVSVSATSERYSANEAQVPLNTASFVASWYSPVEDKYYRDEFPFPIDRLLDERDRNRVRKGIGAMRLHVFPQGHASLYHGDISIMNYTKIVSEPITDEVRAEFLARFRDQYEFDGSDVDLEQELQAIRQRDEAARMIDRLDYFNWSIEISTDAAKRFRIVDCQDNLFRSSLKKPHRGALPRMFSFEVDAERHEIYLDRDRFYDFVKASLAEDSAGFKIRIDFDREDNSRSQVSLLVDGQRYDFHDFEVFRLGLY